MPKDHIVLVTNADRQAVARGMFTKAQAERYARERTDDPRYENSYLALQVFGPDSAQAALQR